MIKTLKTIALAMLATGATVTAANAAAITYASTNLFQPLTVTLSVYQQKSITAEGDSLAGGVSASFKTANLLTAVTNTLGVGVAKGSILGYVTYETNGVINTNSPILSSNLVNAATNAVTVGTSILPLISSTTNLVSITNTVVATNSSGLTGSTNGSTTNVVTVTNLGTTIVTNGLAIGDSGSNTITLTNIGGTNAVIVAIGTNVTTNFSITNISLNGDTAVVGSNSIVVETNTALGGAAIGIDTNSVTIETNGVVFTNLTIGTNTVTISITNAPGTNTATDRIVSVSVSTTNVTIATNAVTATNGVTTNNVVLTVSVSGVPVSTNTGASTNALTNLVLIGSDVIVSNGTTAGFGTNPVYSTSLDNTLTFGTSSNLVSTTNSTVTFGSTTNMAGVTNSFTTNTTVTTTNLVIATNVDVAITTTSYTTTNVLVTNGFNTTNEVAAGPAELAIQEPTGKGATASFEYISVPAAILAISNVPANIDIVNSTIRSTTTNESDYSIKTMTLNATNVSFKLQGLVHSTLDSVTVASATALGKKVAVTNEAWTDITGYGTNVTTETATNLGGIVLSGTAAVGTPSAEKQQ
jgi:hypothetical protein